MKRAGAGEGQIIQVQGGYIIRATGRKDRHSKVYTAKGPRDRRVRLSAHTAIQFYDVQDRLGYDRPSKAIDWLIKKAKNAIDKLSESTTPQPNEVTTDPSTDSNPVSSSQDFEQKSESSPKYSDQLRRHLRGNSMVMPPPAETQSIADSMKSFFPMSSGNSLMNLQSYSNDRISRTGIPTGDLGLSLQTLQDQNLNHRSYTDEVLLSGTNPVPFEANYAKSEAWNGAGEDESRHVAFIFNPNSMAQQLFYSQNSAFSQKEPLQTNYPQLIHSWNERHLIHSWNERQFPSVDHQNAQDIQFPYVDHQNAQAMYGIQFGSNFQVPAQIHGEDDPGMLSNQPSSVSPSSQQL